MSEQQQKPAEELVIADTIADWCNAKLAWPVDVPPGMGKTTAAAYELMDRLFEARTTPGMIVIGGPCYGKTLAQRFRVTRI